MRPGSIVVSGNKKRRSAHTETRRPGPEVIENERVLSTPAVRRKGRQFYRIFLYKLFPVYRLTSINRTYVISRVGFSTHACAVWPSGSAGGMGGTAGKKNVGSGLTVWPDASGVLALQWTKQADQEVCQSSEVWMGPDCTHWSVSVQSCEQFDGLNDCVTDYI